MISTNNFINMHFKDKMNYVCYKEIMILKKIIDYEKEISSREGIEINFYIIWTLLSTYIIFFYFKSVKEIYSYSFIVFTLHKQVSNVHMCIKTL